MILRKTIPTLLFVSALWAAACGSDSVSDGDRGTDTSTDTAPDNDGGTTGDSDSSEPSDVCMDFHNYAEGCEVTGQPLVILDLICSTMDSIFIDSFLRDTMECFTPESCEEFIALLSTTTDTDTDPDAGVSDDAFTTCTESTLLTAEPEPANEDFQQHFCEWAMQCDGELSELQCALYFTDPDAMLMFTVLDEPYITDADACVYPMPSCTDDVTGCLEDVTADVSSALGVLSTF